MMKTGVYFACAMLLFYADGTEGCTTSLCQTHCEFGYYDVNIAMSWGTCNCVCCPPVSCHQCTMRKKIIARDANGCMTCKCGWLLK